MRILHVLHNSVPLLCGYSIRSGYIVNIERAMGWDPHVVTSGQHPNGDAMTETIAGTEYRRTAATGNRRLPFAKEWALMRSLERQVEGAVRDHRPDVIHAHSPVLVGLPALRVARRLGIPMVYEIRDLWENASVDRGRFAAGSPLYRIARGLESYVLRNAGAVVTICDLLKNEIAPRAGKPDKVHVIANGVDTDAFRPQDCSEPLKKRWGLIDKEVILYAGTFQPYEGLDLLVRAMAEIVRSRPRAHLVIVGGSAGFAGGAGSVSPEESALLSAVQDSGVAPHVTFTGRIPHADVKAMYALADVLCYPRRMTLTTALTTPLKPLEGMAMAKPVIASDVPAMCELVSDGVTGLVFKAGDARDLARKCIALLSDSQLQQRLGAAGRDWVVRERQWPSLVAKYSEIYSLLLERPLRRAEKIPA
jgi:PEP-CTERM/exosortase A-associated glycosyltransferase